MNIISYYFNNYKITLVKAFVKNIKTWSAEKEKESQLVSSWKFQPLQSFWHL